MEKELAKLNIFNSIFESVKEWGFAGLKEPLEIIPVDNKVIEKYFKVKDDTSDYTYFNYFKTVPAKYTFELLGIPENFTVDEQKEWFKNYIKNPNSYVRSVLGTYANKLTMNARLKSKLDDEFLKCIEEAVDIMPNNTATPSENKFNEEFTNEEFQDLIFITAAETIYNPEIECELSNNFYNANALFWKRFNELYREAFMKKFKESKIVNDSFMLNEDIEKLKKKYGFELLEDAMKNSKYPIYQNKFQFYLNLEERTFEAREKDKEEYEDFRRREFALYEDLCAKYGIVPRRTKIM